MNYEAAQANQSADDTLDENEQPVRDQGHRERVGAWLEQSRSKGKAFVIDVMEVGCLLSNTELNNLVDAIYSELLRL